MKFIKNFAVFVLFIMLSVSSVCFAEDGVVTQNATGDWVYETTIGSLVNRRIREEIKLINNSSYPLTHVTCTVTINGKNHDNCNLKNALNDYEPHRISLIAFLDLAGTC